MQLLMNQERHVNCTWCFLHTLDNTICNTILFIQYIEGFNIHALKGAIYIARSISFVAVAAICIDETNIFSMSPAKHIAVHNIATICASMHITPIIMSEDPCAIHIVYSVCCPIVGAIHVDYDNMIVFNTFSTYCHIRCIA